MTKDQDDSIQRAFSQTLAGSWHMIAPHWMRRQMFKEMQKLRGDTKALGNELWKIFYKSWGPKGFVAGKDWIENTLGHEFIRLYEGREYGK